MILHRSIKSINISILICKIDQLIHEKYQKLQEENLIQCYLNTLNFRGLRGMDGKLLFTGRVE